MVIIFWSNSRWVTIHVQMSAPVSPPQTSGFRYAIEGMAKA